MNIRKWLTGLRPHQLMLLGVTAAVLFTEMIVAPLCIVFRGYIAWDYLATAAVTAFIVSFVVVLILVHLITEIKAADAALFESRMTERALMDSTPDAIFLVNTKGIVLVSNEAAAKRLNKGMDELLGYCIYDFLPPDVAKTRREYVEECIRFGRPVQFEDERLGRLIDNNVYPIFDDNGKVMRVAVYGRDITEHKQAEKALQESEERYRSLVENAQDGIYTISVDGLIKSLNPAFEKITGWPDTEWLGRHFKGLLHPDDLQEANSHFQSVLQGENTPVHELRVRSKAGGYLTGEFTTSPLTEKGRVVGAFGIARDITERKKMEEALRESKEKYSTLVERSNDGIVILQDDVIKFANFTVSEIVGIPVKEAIGKPFINFVSPEYREIIQERYKRRIAGEIVPARYEVALLSGNGGKILGEVNASLIEYEGRPAVMAMFRDITERKKMEEALHGERSRLLNIINTMSDGICIVDHAYSLEYVNSTLEKEFGPFKGRKCYEYFHDRDDVCPLCPNEEVFAGKTVRWEQYFLKNQRIYDSIAMPLKNMDGTISKLGIFRDITERKRSEEELKRAYQELNEKTERLERFQKLTIGRELDMISLKKEINELLKKAGLPGKYEAPEKINSGS